MKTYSVKRISSNQLTLDTDLIHPVWEQANINSDFTFPWEQQTPPKTSFRALYDNEYFYFRFDVEDDNVLTHVKEDHKMEVVDSDRVEIFFRQNDKMNPYYCLEMDARGRVLDYVTRYYRVFDYEWQWPGFDNLSVKASENNEGYIVEGAISLSSLKDLGLLKDNVLEAGLYRGYCMRLPNPEAELRWISWVNPEVEEPDFHIPSSFGKLELEQ
ncbi:endoxylanase [Ancylomarina euxinus]|uniref:Endoxylanase n=1 Tax=Ancylomarina euxinus TaxID=2283627 RepID=A0A425Y6L7_9BACT|nr:carbohydrate-binding family 9-like protein [Ancylomarina euxinus]MCZ4694033.1 carbohydrate-binding family 9-like protein [Ancylomarina euxinus]MUP14547.1 endoxylanase [Ancylomarina euxinus]RRG24096.1 endoxylanase [Ancylomarina euxinus]